jgi:branched-chain amino acid transport system substrate-binding protein
VLYDLIGGALDSPKVPRAKELMAKFKQLYGVETGPYGIALYEMLNIYFDALKKVGDPAKHKEIAEAIGATDKMSAEGQVRFDPKTHLAVQDDGHIPITFFQIWQGQRVLIAPSQYATGDFQLPPWMKK